MNPLNPLRLLAGEVKGKSQLALILAIAVFVLDGILGIIFATMAGVTPSSGGILARILLIIPMIQGIPAIRAQKMRAKNLSARWAYYSRSSSASSAALLNETMPC